MHDLDPFYLMARDSYTGHSVDTCVQCFPLGLHIEKCAQEFRGLSMNPSCL
jgi:hypothetical protein